MDTQQMSASDTPSKCPHGNWNAADCCGCKLTAANAKLAEAEELRDVSETPRTDALYQKLLDEDAIGGSTQAVDELLDHGNKLERELTAALSDPTLTGREWMDIESAPKDGTEILVWFDFATVPIVHIAWYRSKDAYEAEGQYCDFGTLEDWEGWWTYPEHSVTQKKLDGNYSPTHWMHLPAAPAKEE